MKNHGSNLALLSILIGSATITLTSEASAADPVNCTSSTNTALCIAYGTSASADLGSTQKLDIYRPAGTGPFPVVVWIHGGAWIGENRRNAFLFGDQFQILRQVARGYAVVLLDYRHATNLADPTVSQVRFQDQIGDVKQAIRWIKWSRGGAQHKLDGSRIALWGHSAGAHLAMTAAVTAAQNVHEPTSFPTGFTALASYTSTTNLVIAYNGVYDFNQNLDWNPAEPLSAYVANGASWLLGCDMPGGADYGALDCTSVQRAQASPISYLQGGPRAFIAFADDDTIVNPFFQSASYIYARVRALQPTVYRRMSSGGHGGTGWGTALASDVDAQLDTCVKNLACQ